LEGSGETYNPVILTETVFLVVLQGSHQMGGDNSGYVF